MKNWIIVGLVVVAVGALWFVLTQPSDDEPEPGGLSSHQIEEEQPFDPYLDDSESAGATSDEEPNDGPASGSEAEQDAAPTTQQEGARPDPDTASRGEARTSEGSDGTGLRAAEARQIADAYLSGASTDPDRNLELYAERVNYYDQGTVSRAEVLRDKRQYLQRWPERNYERTSDVEIVDAGAADLIRFDYRYSVSGGSRNAEGTGWAELGVQRRDGRVQIVSERGGVTDRE